MSLLLGGAEMGKKLCLTILNGVVSIDCPINLTHFCYCFQLSSVGVKLLGNIVQIFLHIYRRMVMSCEITI
jgi:hypothetical protein